MTECLVTHLRHVDLAVPDFERQVEFFTGVWGLREEAGDSGVLHLATESSTEPFSVRVRKGEKRLDLIAFGASDRADVDRLATQLGTAGVQLVSEPGTIDAPGGGYGFRFFDVDGRTVEVSAEVSQRKGRPLEERESVPANLSHVVLNSADLSKTKAFYEDVLGFRLSDSLGPIMCFLRCSPQHHSIAIAQGPHASVHHVSFDMRGIDEFMRGTGRLLRSGVEMVWGPGRHTAGDNTFSYFLDPHGNTVEYTTALELVNETTWEPSVYSLAPEQSDQWGTANPMSQEVAAKSFNEADPGLWTAPPL